MALILKKKHWLALIIRYVRKIVANESFWTVMCCIGTAFFGISLITYSVTDVSCFHYEHVGVVNNWCAWLGAECAAYIIFIFGMSSWLFLGSGLYCIYRRLWGNQYDAIVRGRAFAWLALPFVMALLCAWYQIEWYATAIPGGVMGAVLVRMLIYAFDRMGAALITHALVVMVLFVLAPYTTCRFINMTGRLLAQLVSRKTLRLMVRAMRAGVLMVIDIVKYLGWAVLRVVSGTSSILRDAQEVVAFECRDMTGEVVENNTFQEVDMPSETKNTVSVHQDTNTNLYVSHVMKAERCDASVLQKGQPIENAAAPYELPHHSLFSRPQHGTGGKADNVRERAAMLEQKLECFGVMGTVTAIKEGPVVTLFEYEPRHDTKISKIVALEDDLAMALQALSIRIIAPIPGRSVVGFEVANKVREDVLFATIVHSKEFKQCAAAVPLVLGHDTTGSSVIVDLAKMPHLLVAGSTGSGKSVALNAMLMSLLCRRSPDELKLILIDPKRLEFAPYADIPHLLFPIVTDPRKASPVLAWVVRTMEERYQEMALRGVRNVDDYNKYCAEHAGAPMATIIVVIDELADLMMTASREIETLIARIAQMARAAGIHLLVATQRPSVDVITGLIKVNFPSRISFRVTSKIDSRTILDSSGAEKLLGRGDMLFLDSARAQLVRVHGAYVSDREIESVVKYIKSQRTVQYLDSAQELTLSDASDEAHDQLYQEVIAFVRQCDEVSISLLQRRFRIGFNRSARLIETLEARGMVMPSENGKTRKVIR